MSQVPLANQCDNYVLESISYNAFFFIKHGLSVLKYTNLL